MRNQSGFTLLELLIAVAVFAISLAGFSSVLLTNIRANRVARDISQATLFAQEKIEELRSVFTTPTAGSDTNDHFVRTWTVASGPFANTLDVTVTVQWNDGGARQIRLRSLFSD